MSQVEKGRVLHVLAQRPSLTGSGITLDAMVRQAARNGWVQQVVCGVPDDGELTGVGDLPADYVKPVFFERAPLDFPVPGMSDVMPYRSTRYRDLNPEQLSAYREAFAEHLARVVKDFRPQVIHSHHLWLVSSLLKDVAPHIPVVAQCHATGFRQMELCPELAREVRPACARLERFAVLHQRHAWQLASELDVAPERIAVVGAGYNQEVFHSRRSDQQRGERVLYVGKFSRAKGLPWLLDAVEQLADKMPGLTLQVAGSGSGPEAEALAQRMKAMAPLVSLHGQLDQRALAKLMRRCGVCVLPSFYEGLPLVLVEALACGCRLVATDLPGVKESLAPHLKDALHLVSTPGLSQVDVPDEADLPGFVLDLAEALDESLARPLLGNPEEKLPGALEPFTWEAVFDRVQECWTAALGG